MSGLSTGALLVIFATAAVATWVAGVRIASATDLLDDHFGLGEALGGMILLSIVGSLPELAITVSAAASGDLGIAAGNLIGGVAMQTFVLVIADKFVRGERPLSSAASSLVPALEGLLVIAVVGVTMMSAVLPDSANIGRLGIGEIAIVAIWLLGMRVLSGVRDRPDLALGTPAPADPPAQSTGATSTKTGNATGAMVAFAICAIVTLAAGVVLEQSGNALAEDWGLNGVLFGATFLAAATALPEISTAISGVRLQRYTLVFWRHLRRQRLPAHAVLPRRPCGRPAGPPVRGQIERIHRRDRAHHEPHIRRRDRAQTPAAPLRPRGGLVGRVTDVRPGPLGPIRGEQLTINSPAS